MEQERAERISRRIEEYHRVLAEIYEKLVDREFKSVQKDLHFLILEVRCILKSIEEDDF
jgi:Txe/YoeB family toxin of Txe-Axe toxin-antitoxin module